MKSAFAKAKFNARVKSGMAALLSKHIMERSNAGSKGATSDEPEREDGRNAMEEAKDNLAGRKLEAAGLDSNGEARSNTPVRGPASLRENADNRTAEQKQKAKDDTTAGRKESDRQASPYESVAPQGIRSGALSTRPTVKVGRNRNSAERTSRRWQQRSEQQARQQFGF